MNCTVIIPFSTGTKCVTVTQELPELLAKTKWQVFMAHNAISVLVVFFNFFIQFLLKVLKCYYCLI